MTRLYVGNIRYSADENSLRSIFEPFGQVQEVFIGMDRETGRSRGFAFVTMAEKAGAQAAITGLNGKEVDGRVLVVNEAQPRGPRPGGFGGGGGPRSYSPRDSGGYRQPQYGGPPQGRPPKGGKPGRDRQRDKERDRRHHDDEW